MDTDVPMIPSGEGSSAGASASSKKPKRFEIKKWNAVALWAWGRFFMKLVPLYLLSCNRSACGLKSVCTCRYCG